jgi:hypothetical protein
MTNQFKNVDFDSIFEQLNKSESKKRSLWRMLLNWLLHRNMVKQSLAAFARQAFSRNQMHWSEPYQDKKVVKWGYLISSSQKGVEKVIGVKVEDDHLKVGYVSTFSPLDKNELSNPDLLEWLQAWERAYGDLPGYNSLQNAKVFNIVEKCSFRKNELSTALEKVWKTLQKVSE